MAKTLYGYYQGKGQRLPSLSERGKLYESYGLGSASGYRGSAAQNVSLLGKLSAAPATAPATTPAAPQGAVTGGIPKDVIQAAYHSVFGKDRTLDPEGLRYYSLPKFAGTTQASLETALRQSGEYKKLTSGLQRPDTTQDAQTALSQLTQEQFDLFEKEAKPTVRTSAAIQEEIEKSLLPSEPRPEVPDLSTLYETLREEGGIDVLEGQLNELTGTEEDLQAELRSMITDERGKPILTGLISGRTAKYARNAQEQLDFIGRQKSRITNELNTKLKNVELIMNFTEKDYDMAREDYDKEFSQNLQMINTVQGVVQDEKTDAERIRDNARANFQTIAKYIQSGEINFRELSPDQQFNLNKMEIQAGLGAGFFAQIQPKLGGSEIKSTTTRQGADGYKYADMVVVDADGSIRVISQKLGRYRIAPTAPRESAEDKEIKAFREDAADIILRLDDPDDSLGWYTAFDIMRTKYPQATPALIANTLGGGEIDATGERWGRAAVEAKEGSW